MVELLVVIDVELCRWVSLLGCFEGNSDKVFTQDGRKNRGSKSPLLVENLVDDILTKSVSVLLIWVRETYPLQNLSSISSNLRRDVGLDNCCESIFRCGS
jgi:hypothetical protein